MDKPTFYQRLLVALGRAKFNLNADPIKMLDSTKWLPQPLLSPMQFTNVEGAAKAIELEKEFDPMKSYSEALAFKFLMGSPMIACIVEGDGRSRDQIRAIASTFAQCIVRCTPYTLQPHGVVTGFLLLIFFDTTSARTFCDTVQQSCRHRDTKTKTFVRPWAIDVSGKAVFPERESWFDKLGALAPKGLAKELFST